jgi:hypothetical protein
MESNTATKIEKKDGDRLSKGILVDKMLTNSVKLSGTYLVVI